MTLPVNHARGGKTRTAEAGQEAHLPSTLLLFHSGPFAAPFGTRHLDVVVQVWHERKTVFEGHLPRHWFEKVLDREAVDFASSEHDDVRTLFSQHTLWKGATAILAILKRERGPSKEDEVLTNNF